MKFRPDIEGLRGVAVLLVVLAHAGVPGMAGGFIGVDVFFVISGYLITGLLTAELAQRGTIDLWAFYARRARRLASALLVMVLAVSGIGLFALHGEALQLQLASGRWAALWLSNVYFSFAAFDYFDAAARDSLFLHTWSLGVEEQFYLVWPLLVALAWKRLAGRRAWLAWLVCASFAASLLLMPFDAVGAYYLMPTRLWQLGLGGLVYLSFGVPGGAATGRWSRALGWGGAGLLVAAMVLIDDAVAYPGLWALLPALAAAGLLAAGTGRHNAIGRILSSPVLTLPGRISYSWYLWHWPILTIGPLLGLWPTGGPEAVAAILVSFLVAWASYSAVEQPVRRGRRGSPRLIVLVSILASVAVAALLQLATMHMRPPERGPMTFEQRVAARVAIPSVYADPRCDQEFHSAELVPCEVVAGDGSGGVMVLIGDSIGTHWLPALEHVASKRAMRLVVMTKSSCPIVDEPFVYARIRRRFTECEDWRAAAMQWVQSNRPDVVVIGSSSGYGFSVAQWVDGSGRVIHRLQVGSPHVVVLAPSPRLAMHGPGCIMRHGRETTGGLQVDPGECATPLASAESREVVIALAAATAANPPAVLLDLNDLVCPGGICSALRGGRLVYRDDQHLDAAFVRSLGPDVERRFPRTADSPAGR